MKIQDRKIGPGEPVYIIAELSGNHLHRLDTARELVHAARAAGADAVKLQTYTADTLTIDCDAGPFRIRGGPWADRTLYDLYRDAYTPWEWQAELKALAEQLGLHCFSTPFDETAVDFLEDLRVPAYKIASFENVDIALLRRVAHTRRPVIVSTGMASMEEITEAVQVLTDGGAADIALLKCTSAYPAPLSSMNLRTIPALAEAFDLPVGLSDHTLGHTTAVASVALGACLIEKHLTLSRAAGGPDSAFSAEPGEFAAMVAAVREAEVALGRVTFGVSPDEEESRVFRRSLFVVQDVKAGEPFTPQNVRSIRPGYGLHTRYLDQVLRSRAATDIRRGTPLAWSHVAAPAAAARGQE